jgi:hypothetical protein
MRQLKDGFDDLFFQPRCSPASDGNNPWRQNANCSCGGSKAYLREISKIKVEARKIHKIRSNFHITTSATLTQYIFITKTKLTQRQNAKKFPSPM